MGTVKLSTQQQAKARQFIQAQARPLERALYALHFENGSVEAVLRELAPYQNPDGGFGHGSEPDLRTPDSSAIATSHRLQLLRELSGCSREPARGAVDRDDGSREQARPSTALQECVQGYWVGRSGTPHPRSVIGADPTFHVVFYFGGDHVQDLSPGATQIPRACVSGANSVPLVFTSTGEWTSLHVVLRPAWGGRLTGMPARAFTNVNVDLGEIWGREGLDLWERLAGAATWRRRCAVIDAFLLRRLTQAPRPHPAIEPSLELLRRQPQISVTNLADRLGWTTRQVLRVFDFEVGLTPKQYARVARFQRAVKELRTVPRCNLADMAVSCGFHDQSHMIHEFQALAATTPGQMTAGG